MGLKQKDTDQMASERGREIQQESMSADYSHDGCVSFVVCDKYDNCSLSDSLEIEPLAKNNN